MNNNELLNAISNIMDQKLEPVVHRLDHLENTVEEDLIPRVKKIEIDMENEMLPKLNHIEQCYLDTFTRYEEGIDQLDKMQQNIDVIKLAVTSNSEKISKITGPYLVK